MTASAVIPWLPLLILPTAMIALAPSDLPRWAVMWLLAWAIYVGCKWLSWQTCSNGRTSAARQFAYMALWPGLDAHSFLHTASTSKPPLLDWLFAAAKLAFGVALIVVVVPRIPADRVLSRGWAGMIGILFVLHFGLFHLLSLTWRSAGFAARPNMNWPVLATSVSDFWGRRWNTAFRDLTHRHLFRPLASHRGATPALLVGFVFSGLVHDLVISLPARGGYGGPTAYFLIQVSAIVLERSRFGNRLGLARGLRGRAFAMLVLLGPLPLLFHPPFVREVVVPFLDWLLRRNST